MDLVGVQAGRGEAAQLIRISGRAILQAAQSGGVGRHRHLLLQKTDGRLPRGIDAGRDEALRLGTESGAALRRDARHRLQPRREGGDERVLPGRHRDELLHLGDRRLEDEARWNHAAGGNALRLRDRLAHPRADERQPRQVVDGVRLGLQRVRYREIADQIDIGAAELLEGIDRVQDRRPGDERLELPLHEAGRDALRVAEPGGIDAPELGESALGQADTLALKLDGQRRHLTFERFLLGSRKVAGADGKIRVAANPVGGKAFEERVDCGWLRRRNGHRAEGHRHNEQQFRPHDCRSR